MALLPPIHQYLPLVLGQVLGRQELARISEPESVMADEVNVLQYDRVMTTKLAVPYALALEVIYRVRENAFGGNAIDLACGPGHLSLLMTKYLRLNGICGCDLSDPMIQIARKNALLQQQSQADFQVCDILDLTRFNGREFDLCTFTDAAHHLPDLNAVRTIVSEMNRITKPEGLVVVMDLARLRTARLTESYVRVVGGDYANRGLSAFYRDFENSMFAAWTISELATCVPHDSKRAWFQIVPAGLPTIQMILGVPNTRRRVYLRRGLPWLPCDNPVNQEMRWEWRLARQSVHLGHCRRLSQ